MAKKPVVAILGGGYGGMRTALWLEQKNIANIVLVDKKPFYSFHGEFYELASFYSWENEDAEETFNRVIQNSLIPYELILHGKDIRFIESEVKEISIDSNIVHLDRYGKLRYDWLVIALGSKTNYFNIKHLEEYSVGLKSVWDAFNIRNSIDELFTNIPKKESVKVVIAGGGFTGCELAAELVGYMKKLAVLHSRPVSGWSCVIVEEKDALLGGASKWAQEKALWRLRSLGITVMLNAKVRQVRRNYIVAGKESAKIEYNALVWAAGVSGVFGRENMVGAALNKKGCFVVDEYLRIKPYKNVFAIGDIAGVYNGEKDAYCAMTAGNAVQEGKYVARALSVFLAGSLPAPYRPEEKGLVVPLGGRYALADFNFIKISGFLAWLIQQTRWFREIFVVMPFFSAAILWIRKNKLYRKND